MRSLLFLALAFSANAFAYQVSFVGPCDKKPLLAVDVAAKFATVGDVTIHVLTKNRVPFEGTEHGLNTVFKTPTGDAALEVISDTEMRAYGWCYFVNDLGPDVYPDEYTLDASVKKIEWIYGFAHYKAGVWVSNCTPAFTIKPKFLCKK